MSTFRNLSSSRRLALGLLGLAGAGGAGLALSLERAVSAADADRFAHAPHFHWPHEGFLDSYDVKSIRRGYEVYKNVCAACHGCFTVAYRMLRNVCMTPEEAKAEAKRATYLDGPNDEGEMYNRPGKTADYLPKPYPNEQAAAYANGGKAPPDLGLITFARHGYENYIFALLTGYQDPPAGFQVDEGLYFNPYFRGGALAMPPPLYNEVLEYSDGTPATKSQCAKDVACFLRFAAEPWHDERKKLALKLVSLLALISAALAYYNRHVWTVLINRKVMYVPKKKSS
ncbi:cytochrome c1, heme protein, mitochondrial [Hyalella azteca]|uniref:Cytochrome c1, heme protein, mitochondrial n=1 Tax=Hyalella azteca TaxID=294128 RepID=A0A8B7NK00_HYAAZ|nr:cytochrome c1, heme protein, mitochondrial [Hyalella azteca]